MREGDDHDAVWKAIRLDAGWSGWLHDGCLRRECGPVGETAQPITGSIGWYIGAELDLGMIADKTGFLIGMKGSLRGWSTPSGPSTTARAGVYSINGTGGPAPLQARDLASR